MAENNESIRLTYFLIGVGVGAAGALLIAPRLRKDVREGIVGVALLLASRLEKELRDRIDDLTRIGLQAAHEIASELVHRAEETVAKSTERLSTTIEEATETFVKGTERLWEAIDVGKQAYMEEKRKAEL